MLPPTEMKANIGAYDRVDLVNHVGGYVGAIFTYGYNYTLVQSSARPNLKDSNLV